MEQLLKLIAQSPELLNEIQDLAAKPKEYDCDMLWNEPYCFYDFCNEFITGHQFYGVNWKNTLNNKHY